MSAPPREITIRTERLEDIAAVRAVNEAAFQRAGEADVVDGLRTSGMLTLSLVAEVAGRIVGHIAFSPMTVLPEGSDAPVSLSILGLGPLAVLPDFQRQRIGTRLGEAGLEATRGTRADAVLLVGNPAYYSRFGFVSASRFQIQWDHSVPEGIFQAQELHPGALAGIGPAIARFAPAFDIVD